MDQRFFFQYVKVIIVAEYGLDLADTYRLGSTLRALIERVKFLDDAHFEVQTIPGTI